MRILAVTVILTLTASAETVRYNYDEAGRLVRAEYEGGKSIEYTYDKAGNLLRREVTDAGAFVSANAASYDSSHILAPNAIAYAGGPNLATDVAVGDALNLPDELLGTSLDVTDSQGVTRRAKLYYVAPALMSYVVPTGTALGLAHVVVHSGAGGDVTGVLQVNAVSPGVFAANDTGSGVAKARLVRVAADGTVTRELLYDLNTKQAVPLNLGLAGQTYYLEMYGTGLRGSTQTVSATIDGKDVAVAGPVAHSVYIGLDQFNLGPFGPGFLASGARNVVLSVDGQRANTVTVLVQ